MKPLFLPLKTEYFNAFLSGEKSVEYRCYGPRWNERTIIQGRCVILSQGYSGKRISGIILGMRLVPNTFTDIYSYGVTLAAIDIDLRNTQTKR